MRNLFILTQMFLRKRVTNHLFYQKKSLFDKLALSVLRKHTRQILECVDCGGCGPPQVITYVRHCQGKEAPGSPPVSAKGNSFLGVGH